MQERKDKNKESQSRPTPIQARSKQSSPMLQLVDNRSKAAVQEKLQRTTDNSPQAMRVAQLQTIADNYSSQKNLPIQKKVNNTGLPDKLKSGIENLSGHSMDDVKVHYNSNMPAQLSAHAFAQGTDIHLASGQEKHLPHEAWHVVQQKQGRVKPTLQMKGRVSINDDPKLEKEADVMGLKTLQMMPQNKYKKPRFPTKKSLNKRADRVKLWAHYKNLEDQWEDLDAQEKKNGINKKLAPNTIKKRQKKLKSIKASRTEVIGEVNATNSILDLTSWKLLFGFAKGVGYDQVWKKPNGTICIVEAKGPGAVLGHSAAKGKQMSKPWVLLTANGMAKSGEKEKQNIGNMILNEITTPGKVEGYVITSTLTGAKAQSNWEKNPTSY
ncbi:MAG: DUF4157 domain-containing protein [Rhodobacteraceae bacterium]|nr:DUF4157 domain-containing protein [Paracoccaceae bacterium]